MASATGHLDATIADLEARRDKLSQMIEELKTLRDGGVVSALPTGATPAGQPISEQSIPHDAFFQMTIPEAAKKYLGIVKRTKTIPQIAEALMAGGLKSSARFFPPTVRATISKDERFVIVNGEWGLSEWYPAMRKERKAKPARGSERRNKAKTQKQAKPTPEAKSSAAKPVDNSLHERVEQSLRGRILEHLDTHPNQWFKAVALALALNAATGPTAARLSELATKGKITKTTEGYRSLKAQAASVH